MFCHFINHRKDVFVILIRFLNQFINGWEDTNTCLNQLRTFFLLVSKWNKSLKENLSTVGILLNKIYIKQRMQGAI